MKRDFRIILPDHLLPVQMFFNSIPDWRFIEVLKAFENGYGAGFNDACCDFPGDDNQVPTDGIEFSMMEEEVILSFGDFYDILCKVCEIFIEDNPGYAEKVKNLLVSIKEKLNHL